MKYVVKSDEISEFNEKMSYYINSEIFERLNIMNNIVKKTLWTGIAKESFSDKYDIVMHQMNKVPKILDLYIDFIDKVVENYDDLMIDFQKRFNEFNEEIGREEN